MNTTLQLMDKALEVRSASDWARHLGITRAIFTSAKTRGGLSPVIAGELAAEIGEDPKEWIVIAALEGGKESACKTKLMRRLRTAIKS